MIRILAKSLREYRKGSLWTVLLSVLEVVFEIIIPLYMSDLIDFGIQTASIEHVYRYGAALLLFAVLELATGILSAKIAARPPPDLPQTCGRTCTTMSRPFLFPISINSQPRPL
jgi:ATP-binding cassette subfamily B protein